MQTVEDPLLKVYRSGMGPQTPWGSAQYSRESAPGITFYGCASHGGFGLSPERYEHLLKQVGPEWRCWAAPGWFEEDQDWAVVALVWPEYFPNEQISARNTAAWSARPFDYGKGPERKPRWESVCKRFEIPIEE